MNRARVAARADYSPRVNRASTLLIPTTQPSRSFVGRGRKAVRMTATQRNSQGRVSEWNRSPYFWTDPSWSK